VYQSVFSIFYLLSAIQVGVTAEMASILKDCLYVISLASEFNDCPSFYSHGICSMYFYSKESRMCRCH
jgi:hypothetical protein